ncbi:hypothetical protein [Billgrantia lactosivorans]|uniref:hypothetical protein n=1 Tax=Billgrantia lactosivorans TaxID=2185141 RepID=UPI000DAB4D7C|nr:hypothetical protein [Halomonas lactosivorans]
MQQVGKWMGTLTTILSIAFASAALAQDTSPPPSSAAEDATSAGEAALGEVPEREDDAGTARDAPERDLQGTGADAAADADGGEARDDEVTGRQEEGRGDTASEPGLDEPRQPIRPGQMEQD